MLAVLRVYPEASVHVAELSQHTSPVAVGSQGRRDAVEHRPWTRGLEEHSSARPQDPLCNATDGQRTTCTLASGVHLQCARPVGSAQAKGRSPDEGGNGRAADDEE